MLNVVAIMGRLARDPEMRQTTTGKNVASFRIACDRGRRDANGQSVADWIDVVAWDRQAEFVCRYFQKGSLIVVDGRLQSRQYQDKTGANRTAVEVVANNINFAGPKSSNAGDGNGYQNAAPSYQNAAPARPAAVEAAPSYSAGHADDFAPLGGRHAVYGLFMSGDFRHRQNIAFVAADVRYGDFKGFGRGGNGCQRKNDGQDEFPCFHGCGGFSGNCFRRRSR